MGKRRIGERTCMVCGRKDVRSRLLRFVVDDEGRLRFDPAQRAPGRGGYLCPRRECLEGAEKKRKIFRRFRREVRVEPGLTIQVGPEYLSEEGRGESGD